MLSRSYRRAAADERRAARQAAVSSRVTGERAIDDAALGWLAETTLVLLLVALCIVAIAGYEAAQDSARSIPLFIVGAIALAAAARSSVRLAVLWHRRRDPGTDGSLR